MEIILEILGKLAFELVKDLILLFCAVKLKEFVENLFQAA
jgi:hypothetical protein